MLRQFKINVTIRVLVMIFFMTAGIVSAISEYYLLAAVAMLAMVVAVAQMVRYVTQTNRDVASFLASVKYNDFSTSRTPLGGGKSFKEMRDNMKVINAKFMELRQEKEMNFQLFESLVNNIQVGILCVDAGNRVLIMNKALQALLHRSYLPTFDTLKTIDENFWFSVQSLLPSEGRIIPLNPGEGVLNVSVQLIRITLKNDVLSLYAFQNIHLELEEKELQAWHKLIRILTHEIMNSVAPIASLSATAFGMLPDEPSEPTAQVKDALHIIQRRSEGLLTFTDTYRRLTRIPPPKIQEIDARVLLEQIRTLVQPQLDEKNIRFQQDFDRGELKFQADPHQMEQVLINILKNAMEALDGRPDPEITLYVQRNKDGKLQIQIGDNGSGIPKDVLEQVFVPFYTTKKEGSGIGLSLSRQILRMQKGNISLQSAVGKGTVVTVVI